MAIIAVAALKGGAGKSTIAVNLAAELGAVLVDADLQGTTSQWGVGALVLPLENIRDASGWLGRVLALDSDFVVIDCPPHLATVTEAAVGIADLVLLPVSPSGADLTATATALELIARARYARADGGPKVLLVPSRVDVRTSAGREIRAALKNLGEPVAPTIRQRAAHVDAFSAGQAIRDYAPASTAHEDFKALARRVRKELRT